MNLHVDINIKPSVISLSLPVYIKDSLELKPKSMNAEITVDVRDFPNFIGIMPSENKILIKNDIVFDISSQRFVIDTDPVFTNDIDFTSLNVLDIKDVETIYGL